MTVKRYKVTGEQPVLDDRQPGEVFEANVPEDQAQFLISIGALKLLDGNPRGRDKKTSPDKKD